MPEGRIFISYRRGIDSHVTGRLYDALKQKFGADQLFMDVDTIPPGTDFVDHLETQVAQCSAFLAVVGPGWSDTKERLHDPSDFVRIEISAALKRPDIPVIPVLVDDTEMPSNEDLPHDLHPLTRRAGIVLPHDHFSMIVDGRLSNTLRAALDLPDRTSATGQSDKSREVAPEDELIVPDQRNPVHLDPPKSSSNRMWNWAGIAIPAILGVGFLYDQLWKDPPTSDATMVLTSPNAESRVPISALSSGDRFWDCSKCPAMIVIPGGKFDMGSPDEEPNRRKSEGPQRRVIVKSFGLAATETTFEQWQACVDDGGCRSNTMPSDEGWGRGKRPVIYVSWDDANEYVGWLNSKTVGSPYRLPTEAEWEYSARAFSTTAYPWGSEWDGTKANGFGTAESTLPVGSFRRNSFGLFDMIGNVREWVQDCQSPNYQSAPQDGSAWVGLPGEDCRKRVVRGGTWISFESHYLRSAKRAGQRPSVKANNLGFRVARTITD